MNIKYVISLLALSSCVAPSSGSWFNGMSPVDAWQIKQNARRELEREKERNKMPPIPENNIKDSKDEAINKYRQETERRSQERKKRDEEEKRKAEERQKKLEEEERKKAEKNKEAQESSNVKEDVEKKNLLDSIKESMVNLFSSGGYTEGEISDEDGFFDLAKAGQASDVHSQEIQA